ncbi:hypothetical protein M0D46_00055 [Xanthomonas prunicola]|uniref:hypothetical protein n=1 Tax=Xanthomonas prunicola TaxID=2053930 RepID=UPI0021B19B5E|nr:hypothetical protein [Xanthomonas prunicola]UXA69569.1 hypothetical protein M0D46_00055 [Xanthomonas prunicola]
MAVPPRTSLSGILFVAAGPMFFVAAVIGRQLAFAVCGAMFVALGTLWLLRTKTNT